MPPDLPRESLNITNQIVSPNSREMGQLCRKLEDLAGQWTTIEHWPADALRLCADAGVFRWFLKKELGGTQWSPTDQTLGYLGLAQADLLVTFVITQYMGAIRRISTSQNQSVADECLANLLSGDQFATVGISQLTTSGRHLKKPMMGVRRQGEQFVFSGVAPWVTGAAHADWLVLGGVMENGEEVLVAVPSDLKGIQCNPGAELIALSASCTDKVICDEAVVDSRFVIAGPCEDIMSTGTGGTPGGLQTSTLATGLASAAIDFLKSESAIRDDLAAIAEEFSREHQRLKRNLISAMSGDQTCDAAEIRSTANSLVMRSTQAAMTAAKGAGFLESHPVGRWCKQSLFFLVWSCPQPVASAHLCELAGIR